MAKRPDLLVILADRWSAGMLGCAGGSWPRAPGLGHPPRRVAPSTAAARA